MSSSYLNNVIVHRGRGAPTLRVQKDPDAVSDYRITWGDWLRDGESIASDEWISDGVFTIDSSASLASEVINGVTHTDIRVVWLSGGTAGQIGKITNRITTDSVPARVQDASFWLRCEEQ